MPFNKSQYLQPSNLCDFDKSEALRSKALELVTGCKNREEKFNKIFTFVKAMPYTLEDWDVKASLTLQRGSGMCSGKTNLLIALLRSSNIPARYRIFQIKAETDLWGYVIQNAHNNVDFNNPPLIQDHVDCEVWLGRWINCDPSRDPAMERGLLKIGASLERKIVIDTYGKVNYLHLALVDEWARDRQARRKYRSERESVFRCINKSIEDLRLTG